MADKEKDPKEPAKSTGVNTTDAGGVKTGEEPGAASGESAELTAARAIVAKADAERIAVGAKGGRLPQVLKSALDIRRGDEIYRLAAGTVVTEAELTDAEFDHALANDIIGEATVGDLRAAEAKRQQAASEAEATKAKREALGDVRPKSAHPLKPPAGATLQVNLTQSAAEQERTNAARALAIEGTRRPMPAVAK